MSKPGGSLPNPSAALRAFEAKAKASQARSDSASGGLSPLVAGYNSWVAGHAIGPALPRPMRDFLAGAFAPMSPMVPIGIDEPPEGADRPGPRRWQYPVGWNLPVGQPGMEGYKLATFDSLRRYADGYSVVRAMLNIRKDELAGTGWDIGPTKAKSAEIKGDKGAGKEVTERATQMVEWFRRPDPDYYSYQSWFGSLLEEQFVIDAVALHLHPTRVPGKGLFRSDLGALAQINGATIRPLVDVSGATPRAPSVAYQQYIHGTPRVDLMSLMIDADLDEIEDRLEEAGLDPDAEPDEEYRADQLLYLPRTQRVWTKYGFSAIEQALVPITLGLNRQSFLLDYFSEGTIPGVYVIAGDSYVTPSQQKQLQDSLNAIAGDTAWKHRVIVLPPGSKTDPQKDLAWAKDVDQSIVESVGMILHIQPHEVGMTPGGRSSGLGGKGMAEEQARAVESQRALPDLAWWKANLFDVIIQKVWRQPDLEWKWVGWDEEEDETAKAERERLWVSIGKRTIDELRVEDGLDPFNLALTSTPVVIAGSAVVPLDPNTPPPPPPPAPAGGVGPDGQPLPGGPGGQGPAGAALAQAMAPKPDKKNPASMLGSDKKKDRKKARKKLVGAFEDNLKDALKPKNLDDPKGKDGKDAKKLGKVDFYTDETGVHPVAGSEGYDPSLAGSATDDGQHMDAARLREVGAGIARGVAAFRAAGGRTYRTAGPGVNSAIVKATAKTKLDAMYRDGKIGTSAGTGDPLQVGPHFTSNALELPEAVITTTKDGDIAGAQGFTVTYPDDLDNDNLREFLGGERIIGNGYLGTTGVMPGAGSATAFEFIREAARTDSSCSIHPISSAEGFWAKMGMAPVPGEYEEWGMSAADAKRVVASVGYSLANPGKAAAADDDLEWDPDAAPFREAYEEWVRTRGPQEPTVFDQPQADPDDATKYDDSQPRDDNGRWAGGGTATLDRDPKDVLDRISSGQRPNVDKSDVASVLAAARARGGAPVDLTELRVNGTMQFGANGLGFARDQMPQIPPDRRDAFLKGLGDGGVSVTKEDVDPASLQPIQKEINAAKVGSILDAMRGGQAGGDRIIVSKDSYVLDGHHHWGAATALSFERPGTTIPVWRIGMPHDDLLWYAEQWDAHEGVSHRSLAARPSMTKDWDESAHPRDELGRFSTTGGDSPDEGRPVGARVGYFDHSDRDVGGHHRDPIHTTSSGRTVALHPIFGQAGVREVRLVGAPLHRSGPWRDLGQTGEVYSGYAAATVPDLVKWRIRYKDSKLDGDGGTVHSYLLRSYPADDVDWAADADWHFEPHLALSDINMGRRPGGRDPKKVESIADSLGQGASMDPIVVVETPGEDHDTDVADGYHRTLGCEKAGWKDVPAFVGKLPGDKRDEYIAHIRGPMQDHSASKKKAAMAEVATFRRYIRKGGPRAAFGFRALDPGLAEELRAGADPDAIRARIEGNAVTPLTGGNKTIGVSAGLAPYDLAGDRPPEGPGIRTCARCGMILDADGRCPEHGRDQGVPGATKSALLAAVEAELARRGVDLGKYNDNHDDRGRFASADAGGLSTGVTDAARQATLASGGATISLTGEVPTTGFIVAVGGHSGAYDEAVLDQPKAFARAMNEWYKANADMYAGRTDLMLGVWHATSPDSRYYGKVVFDPVEHTDDEDEAHRRGAERGEEEIYDIANERSVPVRQGKAARRDPAAQAPRPDDGGRAAGVLRAGGREGAGGAGPQADLAKYREDQARDDHGRFSDEGGSGGAPWDKGADSQTLYKAGGAYTAERQAIHDRILADMFAGHAPQPPGQRVALMLGGGPASGKSSGLRFGVVVPPPDAVQINADDITKALPEWDGMQAAGRDDRAAWLHEEASELSKVALSMAAANGNNVVYDSTGDNSLANLEAKIGPYADAGYRVDAHYFSIPVDTAIARAEARADDPSSPDFGRNVPESTIRETYRNVANTVPAAIDAKMWTDFQMWSNDVPQGTAPTLIASYADKGDLVIADQPAWDAFLASG